ncbi:vanadium-dependent haloperoxidase [Spirosoma daeguense]
MTIQVMTAAPKNTPTYGSRALGYLGLTMYESVVWGNTKYRSIATTLCDTLCLPQPDNKQTYCWELALNSSQAYLIKQLYGYTNRAKGVDSLANAIHEQYAAKIPKDVVARSETFGEEIAKAIYNWSKSDGGHEGYKRNFPEYYSYPKGKGLWVPPAMGQSASRIPLHPMWGANRTFVQRNGQLPLPEPMSYSVDSSSAYYKGYKEVYDYQKGISLADRNIVFWWGDDPSETCSPPGHSYNLGTIAIKKNKANLTLAAQTYCRIGMAVADAFVLCWRAKFAHNVERPSSYVMSRLDTARNNPYNLWISVFLEPPFPAFYSGHATQSAATATVLTDLYGNKFSFIDDTHKGRQGGYAYDHHYYKVDYKPRHYTSFWEAAKECAESRLMGGIHTRHDNDVGLAEGAKVGYNINTLRWK